MKNLFTACFIVLMFSCNIFADLVYIPTEELVKESDLIVVGTLRDVSEYSDDGVNNGEGKIVIEQLVTGNVKTNEGFPLKSGDKLKLMWSEGFACVYGSHRRTENKKGIWLLTIKNDGTVSTAYPGRFTSLDELGEIKKILSKTKTSKKITKNVGIQEIGGNKQQSQNPESIQIQETYLIQDFKIVDISPENKHSVFNALIVALFSLGLYWILYRSRFKIR